MFWCIHIYRRLCNYFCCIFIAIDNIHTIMPKENIAWKTYTLLSRVIKSSSIGFAATTLCQAWENSTPSIMPSYLASLLALLLIITFNFSYCLQLCSFMAKLQPLWKLNLVSVVFFITCVHFISLRNRNNIVVIFYCQTSIDI